MAPRSNRINPETQKRGAARSFTEVLDTYYAPARDRRKEAADQKALGQITGLLQQKADQMKKARNENEFTQGTADAMREEAGQELQGIKNGGLFRQNSVYYKAGLNEQKGKVAGQKFRNESVSMYENWAGKNASDDPAAFNEWYKGQQSIFVEQYQDQPDMLAAALPYLNETFNNLGVRHQAYTDSRLQEEHLEAYQGTMTGIWEGVSQGMYEKQDEDGNTITDWETIVGEMKQEADDMYGFEGGLANEKMVEAALAHADTMTDPTPLIALARAHDSGQLTLSTTALNRVKRGYEQLEQDIASKSAGQTRAQKAARDAAILETQGRFLADLAENPNIDAYDWMRANGIPGTDAEMFAEIVKTQDVMDNAIKNSAAPESEQFMGFYLEFSLADTPIEKMRAVQRAAKAGTINPSDVAKYTSEAQAQADGTSGIANPVIKRRRENYIKSISEAAGHPYLKDGQVAAAAIAAGYAYDEFVINESRTINFDDPKALDGLHTQAEAYANTVLYERYPAFRETENIGFDTDIKAVHTGSMQDSNMMTNLSEDLQSQAEEEQRQVQGLMDATRDAAEQVVMEQPMEPEAIEEAALEAEPEPWDQPEQPSPVAETFYGQMLQSFTDGRDGTKDYISEASTVMQDDPEFGERVFQLADKYAVDPYEILAVMDFETGGSFDVAQKNKAGSGATGLIQFLPKTARALGTSVEELAGMTRTEQMVYVEKYLDQWQGRIQKGNVEDLYMSVLWPAAAGKTANYVLFRKGDGSYKQNSGLDTNEDGTVTKAEAAAKVKRKFLGY